MPLRLPGQNRERAGLEDDPDPGNRDTELVAAARRIVADTSHAGARLSQIALAEKLRSEGHKVADDRLRWLAAVSGLEAAQDGVQVRELAAASDGPDQHAGTATPARAGRGQRAADRRTAHPPV